MAKAGQFIIGGMDDLARLDSPIHKLDARTKILVTIAYIITVLSFPREAVAQLTPLILYPVLIAALGRIPLKHVATLVSLASPFALAIAIFNPWLNREPALAIGNVEISAGWLSFASIMLRFVLTASAAVILVASTGMHAIAAALQKIGMPHIFVNQLWFLYRYLFLLNAHVINIRRAAILRSAGRPIKLRVFGSLAGTFFMRTLDRGTHIHHAMLARGFDGRVRMRQPISVSFCDIVFAVASVCFFVAARIWNLAEIMGASLSGGTH
jgi:cobalt/nickel transport system permease protein